MSAERRYERITTRDHLGAVRTVTIEVTLDGSAGGGFIHGRAVTQEGERTATGHVIDSAAVTRRVPLTIDLHYGVLVEAEQS